MKQLIKLQVNGQWYEIAVDPRLTLLEVLRSELGLTGTKQGCEQGACGACTVLYNNRAVLSCLMLAVEADGGRITTIEGLATGQSLDPLQEAFIRHGAVQCGFCTPGMIMAAKALLNQQAHPTTSQIKQALEGNICRCTGYTRIIRAVQDASQHCCLSQPTSKSD